MIVERFKNFEGDAVNKLESPILKSSHSLGAGGTVVFENRYVLPQVLLPVVVAARKSAARRAS